MSGISFTPAQLEAINNRGGELLVSAAAGSGKTMVLVERLMKYIDDGEDIDKFLVITYTNAAAAELRGKITDKIQEKLAENPGDAHLRRQARICSRANISTIHSFCSGIIRENAHSRKLDITPDFGMLDESEADTVKKSVLTDVLERWYENMDAHLGFRELVDTVGGGRNDDELVKTVIDAHEKLLSHPYPDIWMNQQLEAMNPENVRDAADTVYGQEVIDKNIKRAEYWLGRMEAELDDGADDEVFLKGYEETLRKTINGLKNFTEKAPSGWDEAGKAADAIEFLRPKSPGGKEYAEMRERVGNLRNGCRKETEKIKTVFSTPGDILLDDMRKIYPSVSALFDLITEFDREFSKEKRRRHIIDFSDQEHMALNLLCEKGKPTELAAEISERFTEIMVDEYQDVNEIQELIFKCVSKENCSNLFMVGDMKQSIYRFRLADPTIFQEKYERFKKYDEAKPGEPRKILLSNNYRSRGEILNCVNFIFSGIMSKELGEMDYTSEEYLYHGLTDAPVNECPVEMDILSDDSNVLVGERRDTEARFVAARIKELVESGFEIPGEDGMRPVEYRDITVLLRSARSRGGKYVRALSELGIPVQTQDGDDFFETREVSLMMSFMTITDNPRQDVPLIAVMRSPLFGFTADELGKIRLGRKTGDFYGAVREMAEKDEKCASFLETLNKYRDLASELPADRLIWKIYEDFDMLTMASAMSGSAGRDNLLLLFECAGSYESSGYKGLFSFVSYMRNMKQEGRSPEGAGSGGADGVAIMTIHKSKGLEFPVVILADTASEFNKSDLNRPIIIHKDLGIGPKRTDRERRVTYPTLPRLAINERIKTENYSEEMRILYVALTRAKYKLITVYSPKAKKLKELSDASKISGCDRPVDPQTLELNAQTGAWMMMMAARRKESENAFNGEYSSAPAPYGGADYWDIRRIDTSKYMKKAETHNSGKEDEMSVRGGDGEHLNDSDIKRNKEIIIERTGWEYKYTASAGIPSKLTATELKKPGKALEAAEDALELKSPQPAPLKIRTPSFLQKEKGLSPTEKGTAVHLALEYIDFSKCATEEGIISELKRIEEKELMTREQLSAVKPQIISRFVSSSTGRELLSADLIRQEMKFSLLVPASRYYPDAAADDEILLQGVIDCLWEKDGEIFILDFKTDNVSEATVMERASGYKAQIETYAYAVERLTGKKAKRKILYFLTPQIAIEI